MDIINLQDKTEALPGKIESYSFENPHIGLKRTQFHRVSIPLKSFDSGLDYEEQPVETSIEFDWYELKLLAPQKIDGLNLSAENYPESEASVYVGCAHNWCHVNKLLISPGTNNEFQVSGELFIEFQNEGVAKNEPFSFATTVTYNET